MHRTIMLSSTYQMSSAYDVHAAEVDPENTLLWRASRRRLEAEAIRLRDRGDGDHRPHCGWHDAEVQGPRLCEHDVGTRRSGLRPAAAVRVPSGAPEFHIRDVSRRWLAGGGIKPGVQYGSTDDYGYYEVENKVRFHDLHATMLHLLGLDHKRLTYKYAGRDFRLTDVHGELVPGIMTSWAS